MNGRLPKWSWHNSLSPESLEKRNGFPCKRIGRSAHFITFNLDILPKSVTLLNTGQPLEASVVYVPRRWFTKEGKREQLHIQGLPVNTLLDEVMVVQIEFEELTDDYLLGVSQHPNPEDYID